MSKIKTFAEKLANEYEIITGIGCNVIDMNDRASSDTFYNKGFCSICLKYRKQADRYMDCLGMMSYSCMQSEQWGGKYESLCPISLAFISTMIYYNGQEKLGLCLGPFLMLEVDDFISEDIASHFDPDIRGKIINEVANIPYIEISNVSAYTDMLYMISCYASERNSLEISILEQIAGNNKQQFDYITAANKKAMADYPLHTEQMLQDYISHGDKKGAQSALNKLVSQIFLNAGGDIEIIKVRVTELLVLLSRAAIEGGADVTQIFGMNQDYMSSLYSKKSLNDLNKWLSDVLIKFSNSVFDINSVEHSDIIMTLVGYIRNNYMQKITMRDISEHVKLSISYISRIFKKEMGCSVTSFINKVRIDNAKIMLLEQEIPLVEVAYLCGFEEQTYFCKVFKRFAGVSPGKFREKRGKYFSK